MAHAALETLAAATRTPEGGVVVTASRDEAVDPLLVVTGDHPVPGPGSLAAADAVGDVVRLIQPGDDVIVLISGGASSLMAAPTEGISVDGTSIFQGLHRAGAPIEVMNAFRKRVMRWGAGRLAVALQGAQVTAR